MATTRKQPTSTKKGALALPSFELTLKDFRIINLTCERFLAPELAPKGAYAVEASSNTVKVPKVKGKSELSPSIAVTYRVQVIGTKSGEGKKSQPQNEKSFSIDLSVEGFFELSGKDTLDANDLANQRCMSAAIQQLHVLSIDRVRALAAELGYKGVRPSLGTPMFELKGEVEKLS